MTISLIFRPSPYFFVCSPTLSSPVGGQTSPWFDQNRIKCVRLSFRSSSDIILYPLITETFRVKAFILSVTRDQITDHCHPLIIYPIKYSFHQSDETKLIFTEKINWHSVFLGLLIPALVISLPAAPEFGVEVYYA